MMGKVSFSERRRMVSSVLLPTFAFASLLEVKDKSLTPRWPIDLTCNGLILALNLKNVFKNEGKKRGSFSPCEYY
jgi:hypothetical protein